MIGRIILMVTALAVVGSARADEKHLATLRVGTEVYSNVTVTSVSVTDIFFTHSRGVGNAKLKNLDPAVQKMFRFDPAKSDAQQADQAKANALYNQEVRNSPPPKRPPAPEPEPEPQQPGTANGIRDHPIKAKSFLNQAASSLQIEKWLRTSRTLVENAFCWISGPRGAVRAASRFPLSIASRTGSRTAW